MRPFILATLVAAAVFAPVRGARGQSLADVAKAEEARRKAVKEPAKVYTNDDLRHAGEGAAPPSSTQAPATATPPDSGQKVIDAGKPEDAKKPDTPAEAPKDEKYWRARMTSAQDQLAHDRVLADALQSRINALNTDFVNTDDPAQRGLVEQNRKTALAELERMNGEIDKLTKSITALEEEARKANVPPGWLR